MLQLHSMLASTSPSPSLSPSTLSLAVVHIIAFCKLSDFNIAISAAFYFICLARVCVCVPRLSCGIAFRRRLCRRPRSHLDPCTYLAPSSHWSHNKSCSLAHLTTRIVVAVAVVYVVVAGGVAAASLQFRCCCCCELLLKKNYNVDKLKADRLGGGGRDRALEQCETLTQTLKWPLSASSCGPRNATPCHAKPCHTASPCSALRQSNCVFRFCHFKSC